MSAAPPNTLLVITGLTWKRLWRGRALWISAVLAALPLLLCLAVYGHGSSPEDEWETIAQLVLRLPILLAAAVHLAPAVGEEVELKTLSYLWSRPVQRPDLLLGKLLAVVPALALLFAVVNALVWLIMMGGDAGSHDALVSLGRIELATVGEAAAAGAFAAGAGAIFPRHPFALVIGYVMLVDQLLSIIPGIANASIAYHALAIGGFTIRAGQSESLLAGVIGLTTLGFGWLSIGMVRIGASEYFRADQ